MTMVYCLQKKVNFEDLFNGELERFGIWEHTCEETIPGHHRCLASGNEFLWVDRTQFVTTLKGCCPACAPGEILAAISEVFDTKVFSEDEFEFWRCP